MSENEYVVVARGDHILLFVEGMEVVPPWTKEQAEAKLSELSKKGYAKGFTLTVEPKDNFGSDND